MVLMDNRALLILLCNVVDHILFDVCPNIRILQTIIKLTFFQTILLFIILYSIMSVILFYEEVNEDAAQLGLFSSCNI